VNGYEVIKSEKNPMGILDELDELLVDGTEELSKPDLERMRWAGLFYRRRVPGTFMVRVRTPGGVLSAEQAVALAGIVPLEEDAPTLFDGLTGRALPLVAASAAAGALALLALWRRQFLLARAAAVTAVAAVVAGWGAGQYPWLLAGVVTLDDAAGSRATLWALVIVFAAAAAIVLPALGYLFWLTQRPGWVRREGSRSSQAG